MIERIGRERAAGKSLAAIANGLNADRIPTAQGGRRWYPATVHYTLKPRTLTLWACRELREVRQGGE